MTFSHVKEDIKTQQKEIYKDKINLPIEKFSYPTIKSKQVKNYFYDQVLVTKGDQDKKKSLAICPWRTSQQLPIISSHHHINE